MQDRVHLVLEPRPVPHHLPLAISVLGHAGQGANGAVASRSVAASALRPDLGQIADASRVQAVGLASRAAFSRHLSSPASPRRPCPQAEGTVLRHGHGALRIA